jgi:histidinol-phosphate aminotransferase
MTYQYERVITPASGLRLHLNENTAGCSPRVLAALQTLSREQAGFYPDYQEAIEACSAHLGVPSDELLLTNGLDEGILAAAVCATRDRTIAEPEAIVVMPAFDMYAACADATGARVVEVPMGADFAFPTDAVLAAIDERTRIIFLTTPNNPTGQSIESSIILRIAAAAPQAIVFVDEAYADFAGETLVGSQEARRVTNIVVGRTFAKAHGLAALRVGAVVADAGVLEGFRRVVPPYSLNVCAALALCAALDDTEYYNWYLDQVRSSKEALYGCLDRLDVRYWKSAANFVLADFGSDLRRVVDGLAARQVFIRDRSLDPACPGCARITAGVLAHTRTCISALEEVMCGAAS